MKKFLALLLALVMALSLVACGGSSDSSDEVEEPADSTSTETEWPTPLPREDREPIEKSGLKIGLICVHDTNSGYDVAHIDGLTAACEELGIDVASQVIFKYNVPEDETCADAAVDLAEEGCNIIISDSYGHQSYMMQVASEYLQLRV